MIEWHWPWVFLLLPLPILMRFLAARPRPQQALRVPYLGVWQGFGNSNAADNQPRRGAALILMLIWLALVTAVARPFQLGDPIQMPVTGRDLLLAMDISGSMAREDMNLQGNAVSRLATVKSVLDEFVQRRQGDRIGLILFGANAYVQAPLTFDRETVRTWLGEAQIGLAGTETAIGDAIGLGIKRLLNNPAESRVMVLLTDGANTAGEIDPRQAASLAAENGVRIYTVALGADAMQIPGFFGSRVVNPSQDLDEPLLNDIARMTGGSFFRARNPAELQGIYQMIDRLEPVDQDPEQYRPQHNLYQWPLALAWCLSLLLLLNNSYPLNTLVRRFRRD